MGPEMSVLGKMQRVVADRALLGMLLVGTVLGLAGLDWLSRSLGTGLMRTLIFFLLACTGGLVWFTWRRFKDSGIKAPTLAEIKLMRTEQSGGRVIADEEVRAPGEPAAVQAIETPVVIEPLPAVPVEPKSGGL